MPSASARDSGRRLKFLAAGSVAAAASPSMAGIVVYDINPSHTMNFSNVGTSFSATDINLQTGTFTRGTAAVTTTGFQLHSLWNNYVQGYHFTTPGYYNSETGNYYPGQDIYYPGYSNDGHLRLTLGGSMQSALGNGPSAGAYTLRRFLSGEVIGSNASFSSGFKLFNVDYYGVQNDPTWVDAWGQPAGYVGLSFTADGKVYYGWLETTHEQNGNYTFTRFAFENIAGQSILAGQTTAVPEASTLGFAGGLFGLVVAAHLRRRKARQAAAPDSLLNLAGGEFRN